MNQEGIVINNPKIIDLFSFKFYVGPHKGGFGSVNYNPKCKFVTYRCKKWTLDFSDGTVFEHLGKRIILFFCLHIICSCNKSTYLSTRTFQGNCRIQNINVHARHSGRAYGG